MTTLQSAACFLFASFLCLVPALGGVRLKMESRPVNQAGLIQTGWLYLDGENSLRVDSNLDDETGLPETSMIFRGDIQTIYMIEHEEESFLQLDQESIKAISGRISEAMKQMEEQLAQLPEGQRKIVEDMMKKNMPQEAAGDLVVEVKNLGADGPYRKYEVWIGGQKRSEAWTSSTEDLGIPADSLDAFASMSAFYQNLLSVLRENPLMQSVGNTPFLGFTEMEGFPVRILHLEEQRETVISEATETDFPEGFFDPPSDYQKVTPQF